MSKHEGKTINTSPLRIDRKEQQPDLEQRVACNHRLDYRTSTPQPDATTGFVVRA